MILVHSEWEHVLHLKDGSSSLLILENPLFLRNYLFELSSQIDTSEGKFVLSDEKAIYELKDHLIIVTDPLMMNIDDKRIQAKINKLMQTHMVGQEHYLSTSEFIASAEKYAQDLESDFPYLVEHKEVEYADLIRFFGFKPTIEYESPVDKLLEYTNLMHDICSFDCFVFVGLSFYFSEHEINTFLHETSLNKHNIVLLEANKTDYYYQVDETIVVDKDHCEIF